MKKFELYFGLVKIPLDFCLAVAAFISALHFRVSAFVLNFLAPVTSNSFYFEKDNFVIEYAIPMAFFLGLIFAFNGLYSFKFRTGFWSEIKIVFVSILFWIASIISYFFLIRDFPFSRFVLVVSAVFIFCYLVVARVAIWKIKKLLMKRGYGVQKVVLLVNDKSQFKTVLNSIKFDLRYKVVGYIARAKFKNIRLKYYGETKDISKLLATRKFDNLLQIGENGVSIKNTELIELCRYYHKEYQFVPEVMHLQRHNIVMSEIAGFPIFRVKPTPLDGWGRVYKRLFDILASGFGIILLLPLFFVVAILIKIDSKGPVFFRHDDDGNIIYRIGYKGRPFCCLKFRTMQVNTHQKRYTELAASDLRKDSPLVKIKNDPRVTKIGSFLRRFDIDELPQLWNVFIGDMSLIGPRPHLTEEVGKYADHHKFVLAIKPGITGLAQVSGRSDLVFEDEVKLDTFYIENWSLLLDLKILLKTIGVVLAGHQEFKD